MADRQKQESNGFAREGDVLVLELEKLEQQVAAGRRMSLAIAQVNLTFPRRILLKGTFDVGIEGADRGAECRPPVAVVAEQVRLPGLVGTRHRQTYTNTFFN